MHEAFWNGLPPAPPRYTARRSSTPARLAAGRLPAPDSHARRTSFTCVTRTSRTLCILAVSSSPK